MKKRLKQAHVDHVLSVYPNEAVILWTSKGLYPVANTHDEPSNYVKISDADILQAQRDGLKAIIHSHPDWWPVPSAADMQSQQDYDVPFGIVSTDGKSVSDLVWLGCKPKPLLGRGFIHGVQDCYSLCRDYYQEKGITISEYPRDWEWWDAQSLYVDNFEHAGFEQISESELKDGDAILFQIRSNTPNHAGIYIGDNLILHHTAARDPFDPKQLSKQGIYNRYQKYATHWLRKL